MAESEWETIRKNSKKRIAYIIGLSLPVLLIAGFFFYNNRDILSNNTEKEVIQSSDSIQVEQHEQSPEMENDDSIEISEPDTFHSHLVSDSTPVVVSETKRLDLSSVPKVEPSVEKLPIAGSVSSLELSSIICRTSDRNELQLLLSVQLIGNVPVIHKKILMMRDELKVIVQSIVHEMEFGTLKKETLKKEIIASINKYVGEDVFSDLKFTEFKVEKATKK
jgi:flagellar basal body-associated protein FliL